MCSNNELARTLGRIEGVVTELRDEQVDIKLDVKGMATRLDTWEETKCAVHDQELRDLHIKVEAVKDVATSAAFKAAAMYSIGLLGVGALLTWAFNSIGA